MNDRNYDIRLVEKTLKIDKMFEDFLKNKLGKRGEQKVPQGIPVEREVVNGTSK